MALSKGLLKNFHSILCRDLFHRSEKMYYRLIELDILTKSDSNYKHFAEKTAEARRGVKSDYTTLTDLPRLPIDCFRDDNRHTRGTWDASPPSDPTPDLPPDDPIEVTKKAIKDRKDAILGYDGLCYAGEKLSCLAGGTSNPLTV